MEGTGRFVGQWYTPVWVTDLGQDLSLTPNHVQQASVLKVVDLLLVGLELPT